MNFYLGIERDYYPYYQLVGWFCLGIFLSIFLKMEPFINQFVPDSRYDLNCIAYSTLSGFLVSHLLRHIFKIIRRQKIALIGKLIIGLTITVVLSQLWFQSGLFIYLTIWHKIDVDIYRTVLLQQPFGIYIMLNWSSCYLFIQLMRYRRALTLKELELMANLKKAEAEQVQINLGPEFVCPLLDIISDLIDSNVELAETLIGQLSRLMRYSLYHDNTNSLEEELNHLKEFVQLRSIQMSNPAICHIEHEKISENYTIKPLSIIRAVMEATEDHAEYSVASYSCLQIKMLTDHVRLIFHWRESQAKIVDIAATQMNSVVEDHQPRLNQGALNQGALNQRLGS